MWKLLSCSLLFASCLDLAATDSRDKPIASQQLGNDLFIAGGAVTVVQAVAGDLIMSGGNIDVDSAVAGDALALGGKLRLGADIGQSVYAAAGQITIKGKVGRNARLAGGQIELGPQSEIAGNVSAVGGQLGLSGSINGHVQAAGGRILIDGPIAGDVIAHSSSLELGPNARIAGKLRYRSREALKQDPKAEVTGGIEQLPSLGRPDDEARKSEQVKHGLGLAAGGLWTLGLVLLAGLLLALLPGFTGAVGRTLRLRLGASLLLGFAWLVCVPVAAVILCFTLVGMPLAMASMALYVAMLPLAYVLAAISLGDWVLAKWLPTRAAKLWVRISAIAVTLFALSLLSWIPLLGWLIGFNLLLAGLGALLLQARQMKSSVAG